MKISNNAAVPVYTISGAEARPLPDWLVRKRKRSLKQDPEFANRVELLQDFEFEEASQCVRVSEDGDWVMSTGTYKPQIHVHHLAQLSLSFARHTNCLNQTFLLLSSDYTKSIHLQTDRFVELHTAGNLHQSIRIPRFGRDLVYDRHSAETLIPSVGVNSEGTGEVFRLNLELGRFMKSYEVDVGGDDTVTAGAGSLQGGIHAGSVNTGAIAEDSHNLLAFGTSIGTVEFWDPRSRNRAGILSAPNDAIEGRSEITALQFHRSGLELATGGSNGLIHLYDLRSPVPLLKKDQGYGYSIKNIIYLNSSTSTRTQTAEPKILTADKRIIKIWDARTGSHWTSVEPAVDLNHVEWCRDSGMLLTANEGAQQHAFFIPQLGPAPRWCGFLDNIVEEMAEDPNDPSSYSGSNATGEVYDNFKFLTLPQLRQLNLEHLVGTTSLLRPYMHGYFVAQKLYEEARLISNPDLWTEQRQKNVAEKIAKERESRIRGNKKAAAVKVNRALAERILEREEKAERKRAKRVLERGGDDDDDDEGTPAAMDGDATEETAYSSSGAAQNGATSGVLTDPRFAALFQDEDFEVDERSHEFQAINPVTSTSSNATRLPKGLTAVEMEDLQSLKGSSDSDSDSDSDSHRAKPVGRPQTSGGDDNRISTSSYHKSKTKSKPAQAAEPRMRVSTQSRNGSAHPKAQREKSFASRVAKLPASVRASRGNPAAGPSASTTVVGERQITFQPEAKLKKGTSRDGSNANGEREKKREYARRSASGNVMRGL